MFPALLPTYNRTDIAFVRGEGSYLFAEDGKRYLDFGAGIAVNAFGHAHPRMIKALTEQAGKLWHTSNLYRVPGQESLSQKLVDNTFADTCFFTNSGTEAIELAIKMARRYHFVSGHPERFHIISFEGAFHGRTYAAINAGGNEKYLEGFGPRMPGFIQIAAGDLDALNKVVSPETAAIIIEPMQGEGGGDQLLRQALLSGHAVQVGGVPQLRGLVGERLEQPGMGVTKGVDGDSRSEIQISLAILGEKVGTLATDEGDIRPVIGGKQSREHERSPTFLIGRSGSRLTPWD